MCVCVCGGGGGGVNSYVKFFFGGEGGMNELCEVVVTG